MSAIPYGTRQDVCGTEASARYKVRCLQLGAGIACCGDVKHDLYYSVVPARNFTFGAAQRMGGVSSENSLAALDAGGGIGRPRDAESQTNGLRVILRLKNRALVNGERPQPSVVVVRVGQVAEAAAI